MHVFELLLVLLAACVALAVLADRLNLPAAVTLVLGGMGLAFVPGLPTIVLDPELVLALFLPPLLQVSAYRTDWPSFRSHLRPILLLAIGAVFFTAGLVGVVAKLFVPSLPWWAAITLGAIVAPPDAVAAASVLSRFRLPKRIVTVLEGESLINDASSLVLYKFAVAAVGVGTVSYGQGALQFFGVALGGALVGWLVGRVAMWIFAHLENTLLDLMITILAGFAAYIAAEVIHASGVLAAVACGLVLGRQQHAEFTARTRIELVAVWGFLEFALTSLVFILIGLQLRGITARLAEDNFQQLALLAAAVSATLIVSRFVWVLASAWLPRALSRNLRERDPMPPWSHSIVIAWTGMRGVVSLAAALALPEAFPGRDIILFLAFCSIFVTLVIQGTTLGWVVGRLGVTEEESVLPEPETAEARAEIATAALEAVRQHLDGPKPTEHTEAATELVQEYEVRAERASIEGQDLETKSGQLEAQQRLRLVAIAAARERLADRSETMDTEAHRALGEELDLEEQQIRRALEGGP
ncbi:Na+/H+ antiporter [Belnapia rosea]|uniref:Na+/H+ antiporter n=1 Tax=Belnapia rosea TaxID=938405 RepID=UPI000890415C|nr:Na+/H+ antiporter [Belnapia rosea]SDB73061.1 sodium/proton antiporter, CPA1 family (TC 2.A.36) [Belnapia rosea]